MVCFRNTWVGLVLNSITLGRLEDEAVYVLVNKMKCKLACVVMRSAMRWVRDPADWCGTTDWCRTTRIQIHMQMQLKRKGREGLRNYGRYGTKVSNNEGLGHSWAELSKECLVPPQSISPEVLDACGNNTYDDRIFGRHATSLQEVMNCGVALSKICT